MNILAIILIAGSIIFFLWLQIGQKKTQKLARRQSDEFWDREAKANQTKNKDISQLPLLHVSESDLVLSAATDTSAADNSITDNSATDKSVIYFSDKVRTNIKEPMMDLSSYSNTDLKLAYGVGNFKTLSDYDENFNSFLTNLTNLARAYADAGCLTKSRDTYCAAIRFGSRKVSDYTELGQIYLKLDDPQSISLLIAEVADGNHPRKDTVLDSLRSVMASYQ